MGSAALDHAGVRAKKGSGGSQLWKKALLHSSLCFVMGFFTGFAPSSVSDWRSPALGLGVESSHVLRTLHSAGAVNRSLLAQGGAVTGDALESGGTAHAPPGWRPAQGFQFNRRRARMQLCRRWMWALGGARCCVGRSMIGTPQLNRRCSTFGAWAVARMSRGERKVLVQGPACSASKVIGWFSRDLSSSTTVSTGTGSGAGTGAATPEIDVHGFAFNSSVLWDPERWGRYPTSEPDKSQDSIRFVQQVVTEDYSKVKGIPSDCSEIMVWRVDAPSSPRQTPGNNNTR